MNYYTFEINCEKIGYYEESDDGTEFYCNAVMELNGQRYENPFWVKYDGGRVLAYKVGNGEYVDFEQADGVYPTCALNILIDKMKNVDEFKYIRFHEQRGEIEWEATLVREGDRITEIMDGIPGRYVILKNGKAVGYGWGASAKSVLVSDFDEAIRGTAFEQTHN